MARLHATINPTAWRPAFHTDVLPDVLASGVAAQELTERAQRDGYLLLRQLLPRTTIRALKRVALSCARDVGIVNSRGHWCGGTASALHDVPAWIALQAQVAVTPEFQALSRSPTLLALFAQIFGQRAAPDQGSVLRFAPPDHLVPATGPHRDEDYLRGRQNVWAAWVPLTDCAVEHGVLAMVPGSHRDVATTAWAAAPMRAGDALLFSAATLHRACPNRRLEQCRLSIDVRFAPSN